MNFKRILVLVVLFGTIGCTDFNSLVKDNKVISPRDNIYNQGKTYIRLEAINSSTTGASKTFLDHPRYLDKDMLSRSLASIYYKEKGITGWSKERSVFVKGELLNLIPHIADAFTKASPSQYILVSSNFNKEKGFFKTGGADTIFGIFILNDKLNVVFSKIKYTDVADKGSESVFGETADEVFVDPFTITKNPYWRISQRADQKFKRGHENWIIIDLKKDTFVKKEDYGKEKAPTEKHGVSNTSVSGSTTTVVLPRMSIKDQLLELKELEATGLITKEDYKLRKALILGSKQTKSIKDKFNELRKLKEDGFISGIDYDHKKSDLLEGHDDGVGERNIKEILAEYLELRDEGFITDDDYNYKKNKLLKNF
jgi:hypothetical protein